MHINVNLEKIFEHSLSLNQLEADNMFLQNEQQSIEKS